MRRMVAPKPRALVWPLLETPSYEVSRRAGRLYRLLVGAAAVMGREAVDEVGVQRELEEGGVRLQATARRVPDRETPPAPRELAVLVADDEEMMRETIEALLGFEGVQVFSCSGGQEALDLFRQRREEIGLVLLDLLMPGLPGDDTARALRRLDPEVKILLSSGCTADAVAHRVSDLRIEGFLQKPYRAQELVAKVRRALGVEAA